MDVEVRHRGTARRMDWPAFEDAVRAGAVPAEAEVRCTPITGDRFVPAGDLEAWQGLARSPEAAIRHAIQTRRVPWLTIAVGLLLALAWVLSLGPEAEPVTRWGARLPSVLEEGEAWRLLTATGVHASLLHLGGNLLFLLWSGTWLERAWGRVDLALLLVAGALAASVASMAGSPDRTSIGASGVACSLLGAAAMFGWRHRLAIPRRAHLHFGTFSFIFVALALVSGLRSAQIGLWGHLAGFGTGSLLGLVLGPGRWRRVARIGVLAPAVAILAIPVWAGPGIAPLAPWTMDGIACRGPATWIPAHAPPGELRADHPSGTALVVLQTTVGEGGADLDTAVDALLDTVHETSPAAQVRERVPVLVDGFPALDVVLASPRPGSDLRWDPTIRACVVVRGSYVHSLRLETGPSGRWAVVWRRIRASVRLVEPDALVEARAVARNSPGSARAREGVTRALEAAGTPQD
ncbi:MAG: rhomboid family intramembrane serine protease [Deltaproteobacteria bacterium]|nr:rhomboid family intramembrane serine protease [Deltaproteobacteria bacterium]